ncbi:MAG: zinc ribbon domain-containing protein [Mycobacterium sp.]
MTDDNAKGWASVPTTTCPVCDAHTPIAEFCGSCGARSAQARHRRRADGPAWLRLRAYAASPGEHVLIPSLTGSLFPRLPHRSRGSFRLGLIALAVLLVAIAALRWQGPLIGLCALGLPLLFVIYLNESDAFADVPIRILVAVVVLEGVLGVSYSLFTGAIIAATYDDVLGTPLTVGEQLAAVLAIPSGEVLVMFAPVVLVRLLRPGVREAMDGFAVGALAALCFCAAGTFTRLAPQFETGLVADDRPITDLLVTAIIAGVAIPLTAAAVTGLFGATLWFRPRTNAHRRSPRYGVIAPLPALVVGLLAYVGIGWLDIRWLPQGAAAASYTLIAVLALLALRIGTHIVLMSEVPEDTEPDTTVLCPQCDHIVPDLAFCPSCGVAGRASSPTSRRIRRAQRPVPVTAPDGP